MFHQNNAIAPTNHSPTNTEDVYRRCVTSPLSEQQRLSNLQDTSSNVPLPLERTTLKRHLSLFSGTCFIIGNIIGSGIFVSPQGVLRYTESVGLCLLVWTACGLISVLGALSYAEIGTVIPRSGAELAYMREGIGSVHVRTGDVLAFLFSWASTFILKPSSIAVVTLTSSQYFLSGIMDDCGPPEELVKMLGIFLLLMIAAMNALSVSASNRLNIVFVTCKIITILVVIVAGLVRIAQGYTQNLQSGFTGTTKEPLSIALAFYSGLWAYQGWGSLNSVTEELKNPKRNLSLALALSLPTVIILYILTNISYFTVMSKAELLSSNAVAVTWGEVVLGPVVRALPILIAISALGSANGVIVQSSRYCMVGARYGYLPEIFACIQKQRLTPLPSIVLQVILSIAYCIPSNVRTLINFFSFVAWVFYGLSFVATLCCKWTKKDTHRVINIPIPILILNILIALYLILVPVISNPNFGYLVATVLLLSGLLLYYPFVYRKVEFRFMIQVESQICNEIAQYDRCSTNSACGCFSKTNATENGICAFLWATCSTLETCDVSNNKCHQPNTVCVRHPRCHERPVCYPMSMAGQHICPPMKP
ncbi:unnamed protein product, partial [Adineta steineri]